MKHFGRSFFISVLLSVFLVLPSHLFAATRGIKVVSNKGHSFFLYEDYHALVVGVGDYDYWPDLQGTAKDAKDVSAVLETLGFKVTLALNPTSTELKHALNKMTYGVGRKKNRGIVFYFSGHGETEVLATGEKLGYIVPKDCPILSQDPLGFVDKAISMNLVEEHALRIRSKHVLMVFDSCFSGSLFTLLKAAPSDITEKSNRPVRQFITAGNEDEEVPDRSVFKVCFAQGLKGYADYNKDGYVTGSELSMYLDTNVVNYSRGRQHPQYGKIRHPKLDKGDFVFVTRVAEPEVTSASQAKVGEQSVKESEELRRERERLEAQRLLLEEQRRLEAERERLKVEAEQRLQEERRLLEEKRKIQEEMKRIEEERERFEKERQKLAYVPKSVTSTRVTLRAKPEEISENHLKSILKRYNFYDSHYNMFGSFNNDLVDNGDGTVTDKATGLMWQKSGSARYYKIKNAERYVRNLNKKQFAGYSDWRLPTIDELASLLKKDKTHGMHIDSLFDRKQKSCWSSDSKPDVHYGGLLGFMNTWITNFTIGGVQLAKWSTHTTDISKRETTLDRNYVRAVRSLSTTSTRISLRSKPEEISENHLKSMLKRYGFFDSNWNMFGSFRNDFVDNGDGTVTDKATGLMWQKSGTQRTVTRKLANVYVRKLNQDKFAGYSDWRLPTVDELASLLERDKTSGMHIGPSFDKDQKRCWSSDKVANCGRITMACAWIISFSTGNVTTTRHPKGGIPDEDYIHYYRNVENFLRAVRSLR